MKQAGIKFISVFKYTKIKCFNIQKFLNTSMENVTKTTTSK